MNTFKRDYVASMDVRDARTVARATACVLRTLQRGASALIAENALASGVQVATGRSG